MTTIDPEALLNGRAEIPLREVAPIMGLTPKAALLRYERKTLTIRAYQARPSVNGRRGSTPLVSAAEVRRYVKGLTQETSEVRLQRPTPGKQILVAVTTDPDGRVTVTAA